LLNAGTKLGPYEVVGAIGAGGMGEVYRAHDRRLGRDVAVKVLPVSFASDPERLRRFEQEARAVAALNHPNILAVYDIGTHEGAPFLVTELLEGEPLRERLSEGALPVRKALDIAVQAAHGVAAAHEKGIIHRDLKPANIFLTTDGRVKILDFGLAKLTEKEARAAGETQGATLTAAARTEPGMVLGTVGYMSPEQVRGKPADARSDIFALGTILFEMLSGQRAFQRDTSAETMAAILKEEPPELAGEGKNIPPALGRIVQHCLEKNPAERLQSARDFAFDLESLSGSSAMSAAGLKSGKVSRRRWLAPAGIAALGIAIAAGSFFAGLKTRGRVETSNLSFARLSFKPEAIFNARFAPDGETVVFSAAPEGNQPELFIHRPGYPAPEARGLKDTHLLSISSKGALAVLRGARFLGHRLFVGTLSVMDLGGGAPRDVLQNVEEADWTPDGSALAIIREIGGQSRLEYPIGKALYQTAGYLSDLRFSPSGDRIAFMDHPIRYDDRGTLDVVDLQGRRRVLPGDYPAEEGVAWSKDGKTIYLGALAGNNPYCVLAIDAAATQGKPRTLLCGIQDYYPLDRNDAGALLVMQDSNEYGVAALAPGEKSERNLSWLGSSTGIHLSSDGQWAVFTETSLEASVNYALLLRKTDGSPVVRLGDGAAMGLSRDGKWALSIIPGPPAQLALYPTGVGEERVLERGNIQSYETAQFFPDGKRVLFCGHEAGKATRCYIQDITGAEPRAITPGGPKSRSFGAGGVAISPDGKDVLLQNRDGDYFLYAVDGGAGRPIPWLKPDDVLIQWSQDGRSVLVFDSSKIPAPVERVSLASGQRTAVREIAPSNLTGVLEIFGMSFADGEKSYAYGYSRDLARLAVVSGLK
jgi:serine/threonine protein kinase/Tol biopolymer transport system component